MTILRCKISWVLLCRSTRLVWSHFLRCLMILKSWVKVSQATYGDHSIVRLISTIMQILWGLSRSVLVVSLSGGCLLIEDRAGCCMEEANISGSNNTLFIFWAVKMAPISLPQSQICMSIVERQSPCFPPLVLQPPK